MARVEVLGGLCGASVNYGGVRGSGVSTLQGVELAGYLAGLGPEATALAMVKYMSDDQSMPRLLGLVCSWVNGLAYRERWFADYNNYPLCNLMADLALIEVVSPAVCGRCRGVGFVGGRSCVKCKGSGHVYMSDRSVSESLRVPWSTYRRVWRDRYGRVLSRVQSFDDDIHRAVARQVCADMDIYL